MNSAAQNAIELALASSVARQLDEEYRNTQFDCDSTFTGCLHAQRAPRGTYRLIPLRGAIPVSIEKTGGERCRHSVRSLYARPSKKSETTKSLCELLSNLYFTSRRNEGTHRFIPFSMGQEYLCTR